MFIVASRVSHLTILGEWRANVLTSLQIMHQAMALASAQILTISALIHLDFVDQRLRRKTVLKRWLSRTLHLNRRMSMQDVTYKPSQDPSYLRRGRRAQELLRLKA